VSAGSKWGHVLLQPAGVVSVTSGGFSAYRLGWGFGRPRLCAWCRAVVKGSRRGRMWSAGRRGARVNPRVRIAPLVGARRPIALFVPVRVRSVVVSPVKSLDAVLIVGDPLKGRQAAVILRPKGVTPWAQAARRASTTPEDRPHKSSWSP
jgi:hypothetical protein